MLGGAATPVKAHLDDMSRLRCGYRGHARKGAVIASEVNQPARWDASPERSVVPGWILDFSGLRLEVPMLPHEKSGEDCEIRLEWNEKPLRSSRPRR